MQGHPLRSILAGACLAIPLGVLLLVIPSGEAGDFHASSHKDITCTTCHTVVANVGDESIPIPNFDMRCRGCHTQLAEIDNRSGLTFHTRDSKPCLECHSFHRPDAVLANDKLFTMNYSSQSRLAGCYACHGQGENTANLSPGHRAAAGIFHTDYKLVSGFSPSDLCLVCHSENSTIPPDLLPKGTFVPTFTNHSNHPVGVPLVLGSGTDQSRIRSQLDSRLRLFSGRIECQTCHLLSTANPGRLVPFQSKADLCLGCHQLG
jgi:predicted CXXCH cytochrome family protein